MSILPERGEPTDQRLPVKVKICGLRTRADTLVAIDAGADAVGFMFYQPSPRHLTLEQGAALCAAVADRATRVGVFVNPSRDYLQQVLAAVELDVLQFHGEEDDAFCRSWNLPWIKGIRVIDNGTTASKLKHWPNADAFLLDAYTPQAHGGTGTGFDWRLFPQGQEKPLILAGGLTPSNVAQAVATVSPWAVDVSSGVESARGIKDPTLIRCFLNEVKHVGK